VRDAGYEVRVLSRRRHNAEDGIQSVTGDLASGEGIKAAVEGPRSSVLDMAGPKAYSAAGLLRGYLRATQRRRPMIRVWLSGKAARAFRTGANLAPWRAVDHQSWEEFLAERVSSNGDTVHLKE
jgi:hypothetical protein